MYHGTLQLLSQLLSSLVRMVKEELREKFMHELVQLYGTEEAKMRFVLDPLKIATLEYESDRIPIDVDAGSDD